VPRKWNTGCLKSLSTSAKTLRSRGCNFSKTHVKLYLPTKVLRCIIYCKPKIATRGQSAMSLLQMKLGVTGALVLIQDFWTPPHGIVRISASYRKTEDSTFQIWVNTNSSSIWRLRNVGWYYKWTQGGGKWGKGKEGTTARFKNKQNIPQDP